MDVQCVLSVCVGMREGRGLIVVMAQTIAPKRKSKLDSNQQLLYKCSDNSIRSNCHSALSQCWTMW